VFFIQCAVAATNIVAAIVLVRLASAPDTSAALVLAYTASYVVGSAVSYAVVGRLLGGLETGRLVSFLGRLALAALPASAVALGLGWWWGSDQDAPIWAAALQLLAVTTVDVGLFLLLAHLLRLEEVTAVLRTVTGRLAPRRGGTTSA
jgi:putative peptidoglycan lipid II flippase